MRTCPKCGIPLWIEDEEERGYCDGCHSEEVLAASRAAFNPEGHISVDLGSGARARVSPDCPPETIAALKRMAELVRETLG